MSLKRSGNYMKAFLGWLFAALLLGYQGIVIAYIITTADWRNALNPVAFFGLYFVFLLFIIDIMLLFSPLITVFSERRLRTAAQHNPIATPPVSFQPQRDLALKDGETLRLVRTRGVGNILGMGFMWFILAVLLFASGETIIIALLPTVSRSVLNPFNDILPFSPFLPLSALSVQDWLAVALPLVMSAVLFFSMIFASIISRHESLVADDRGLTLSRTWRRQRFIPWNDISVFLRGVNNGSDAPQGVYLVWGRAHGLGFQIHARGTSQEAIASRRERRSTYRYEGGYDAYEQNARRLLATIAVRSYQPLVYSAGSAKYLRSIQRRFPAMTIDLDTALALPLAAAPFQPDEAAIASAGKPLTTPLILQPKLQFAPAPFIAESLIYFVLLTLFAFLFSGLLFNNSDPYMPFSLAKLEAGDTLSVIMAISIAAIMGFFAVLFALSRRASHVRGITATVGGLETVVGSGRSSHRVEIPWSAVRAWVVVPAVPGGKRPTTYMVFSDGSKLTWVEPEQARLAGRGISGDRQTAFRECAAELHALIAARTGLPLRDASELTRKGAPAGIAGTSAH